MREEKATQREPRSKRARCLRGFVGRASKEFVRAHEPLSLSHGCPIGTGKGRSSARAASPARESSSSEYLSGPVDCARACAPRPRVLSGMPPCVLALPFASLRPQRARVAVSPLRAVSNRSLPNLLPRRYGAAARAALAAAPTAEVRVRVALAVDAPLARLGAIEVRSRHPCSFSSRVFPSRRARVACRTVCRGRAPCTLPRRARTRAREQRPVARANSNGAGGAGTRRGRGGGGRCRLAQGEGGGGGSILTPEPRRPAVDAAPRTERCSASSGRTSGRAHARARHRTTTARTAISATSMRSEATGRGSRARAMRPTPTSTAAARRSACGCGSTSIRPRRARSRPRLRTQRRARRGSFSSTKADFPGLFWLELSSCQCPRSPWFTGSALSRVAVAAQWALFAWFLNEPQPRAVRPQPRKLGLTRRQAGAH